MNVLPLSAILLALSICPGPCLCEIWPESNWAIMSPHYPCFIEVSNVLINDSRIFFYKSDIDKHSNVHGANVWPLQPVRENVSDCCLLKMYFFQRYPFLFRYMQVSE